jgi:hypothetical protein
MDLPPLPPASTTNGRSTAVATPSTALVATGLAVYPHPWEDPPTYTAQARYVRVLAKQKQK